MKIKYILPICILAFATVSFAQQPVPGNGSGASTSGSATVDATAVKNAIYVQGVGTNTITGTTSTSYLAYGNGDIIRLCMAAAPNTSTVTIQINSIGSPVALTKNGGTALASGDLAASSCYWLTYRTSLGGFDITTGGSGGVTGSPVYFSSVASAGPNNTAIETSMIGTLAAGGSTVIPANTLTNGYVLKVEAQGLYSLPATATALTLRVKGATGNLVTGTGTLPAGVVTSGSWRMWLDLTAIGTGAGGSIITNGVIEFTNAGVTSNTIKLASLSPIPWDFTGTLGLDVTAQWATAQSGQLITASNVVGYQLSNSVVGPAGVVSAVQTNGGTSAMADSGCTAAIGIMTCSGFVGTSGVPQFLVPVANDGTTGTSAYKLAKINSSGNAVIAATTDVSAPLWAVAPNTTPGALCSVGTTGNACLVMQGQAVLTFDGAAVIGHYAIASTTVAGDVHDAGTTLPSTTGSIFVVLTTVSGAGLTGTTLLVNSSISGTSFTWRSAYSSGTTYAVNDTVSYGGSSYISIQAGINHQPDISGTFWSLVALAGTNGTNGAISRIQANGVDQTVEGRLNLKSSNSSTVACTDNAGVSTDCTVTPITSFPNAALTGSVVSAYYANSATEALIQPGNSGGGLTCVASVFPVGATLRNPAITTSGVNAASVIMRANVNPDCSGTFNAASGPVAGGAIVLPGSAAGGYVDSFPNEYWHMQQGGILTMAWTKRGAVGVAATVANVSAELVADNGSTVSWFPSAFGSALSASASAFFGAYGVAQNSAEGRTQLPMPIAVTIGNFTACYDNGPATTNAVPLVMNKNGNSNPQTVAVSLPASATDSAVSGCVADFTHSFTAAAGDLISISAITPANTTTPRLRHLGYTATPASGSSYVIGSTVEASVSTTNTYSMPLSAISGTTQANEEMAMPTGCAATNLYAWLVAANANGPLTFALQKNGADTAVTGTVANGAGGTTALALYTGATVPFVKGDLMTMRMLNTSGVSGLIGAWSISCN